MEKRDKQHVGVVTLKGQGGVTSWVHPFRAEHTSDCRRGASQPPALQFPSPGVSLGVSQQGPGINCHSGKCKVGGYLSPTSRLFQKLSPSPPPKGEPLPGTTPGRAMHVLPGSTGRAPPAPCPLSCLRSPALDLVEQKLMPACSVLSLDYPFSCSS